MKIGEVAKQLNIPSSAIRYYEKRGLLPSPNRVSGIREFSNSSIAILRFIKLGQAAGFTINELQSLLERYKTGSTDDGLWKPEIKAKRAQIKDKIKELEQADAVLGMLMGCKCNTIEQCVNEGC